MKAILIAKAGVRSGRDTLVVRKVELPAGKGTDVTLPAGPVNSDYGLFGEWEVSARLDIRPMARSARTGVGTWQGRLPTHERISRLLIGSSILAGLSLGFFVTPWAYLILVGMAVNLIQFSFTGRCKVKDLLDRLGIEYEQPPPQLTRAGKASGSSAISHHLAGLVSRGSMQGKREYRTNQP